MGHERVGTLPKSKRWRNVVEQIGSFDAGDVDAEEIARRTLQNVRLRFSALQMDPGVLAAFEFLLALSVASRHANPRGSLRDLGLEVPGALTPLALARAVRAWVGPRSASAEYRDLAQAAATDAIAVWSNRNRVEQLPLYQFRRPTAWELDPTRAPQFCERRDSARAFIVYSGLVHDEALSCGRKRGRGPLRRRANGARGAYGGGVGGAVRVAEAEDESRRGVALVSQPSP